MMGEKLDWRRIEAELEHIARSYSLSLDTNNDKDKVIDIRDSRGLLVESINLTQVAKELADRLGGK